MMKQEPVQRDERYYAVENASYKIGCVLMASTIMLWLIFRTIMYQEGSWIIFGLVWISSMAVMVYQVKHKILQFNRKLLMYFFIVMVIAAAVPFILNALW
jgi:hypothetical protein